MSELASQQTAQEFLSVLFESAPDAYYLHDLRGIFINSNHAAEELIGYKREELIGKSFLKLNLLPLRQTPKAAALLAKTVLGKDTGPDEFVLNRKNGSQVMIEIRTHPVKVNGQSLTWGITRDITKRKRVEEALQKSEEFYRAITSDYFYSMSVSPKGAISVGWMGGAFERITGYTPESIRDLDEWTSVINPDDSPTIEQAIQASLSNQPFLLEYRIRTKAGQERWLREHTHPIWDERQGQVVSIIGAVQDITEQRQADLRVKHLDAVLHTIRDINQLINSEEDRERLLQSVCEILTESRGYYSVWIALLDESEEFVTSAEAGLGEAFTPMVEQLQQGKLTACGRKALKESEIVVTENPASTCPDCPLTDKYSGRGAMTVRLEYGGKVYGLLSVSMPRDIVADKEEQALFGGVAEDIAFGLHGIELGKERKRMEEALRAAAQQWRSTFDAIGDVVCLLDVEGRILRCNKAMTTLLGKPFSDILGHSCCELIHSSSEPIEGSPLVRMRETRHRETMVLPMGDRWFNVSVHPVLDQNDNLMDAVHIMSDITDRKQAEEQLLAYQQQLRSLASELSLTEERERRRIAGELHDQIGQALALIKMKLGALQEALISQGDLTLQLEKIRELVEKANQATRSLTFALAPPVLYELGLEAGLEWLTENIHQQYDILTEFEGYGQPKPLNDDVRVCLFRAVRELLINVAEHAQARRAKVSIWREDDEVRIEVEDDGVGFDPSELYTPEGRTRGFGLFNIRERLEFLGGRIQLKSEQGSGTRVTLVKPLKPGEASQEN